MGRVINTNSPGKRRHKFMRTIAEILRRMSQKSEIDEEAKDMLAGIAVSLRGIEITVEESITAWEKRGYWKKAMDYQEQWWWVTQLYPKIENLLLDEEWELIPEIIMKLFPHFSDIQINKYTQDPSQWEGDYQKLVAKARENEAAT